MATWIRLTVFAPAGHACVIIEMLAHPNDLQSRHLRRRRFMSALTHAIAMEGAYSYKWNIVRAEDYE